MIYIRQYVPNSRQTYGLAVLSVIGLMAYGLYSQYILGLEPCPLCMTQRFFYTLLGVVALLAVIHNPDKMGHKLYAILIIFSALGGVASAGRQVWLQHLPSDQVPACGPDLAYRLEVFPISEVLQALIVGDGHCAEVVWNFLGLSMAQWSLLWFIGFFMVGIWQLLRRIS